MDGIVKEALGWIIAGAVSLFGWLASRSINRMDTDIQTLKENDKALDKSLEDMRKEIDARREADMRLLYESLERARVEGRNEIKELGTQLTSALNANAAKLDAAVAAIHSDINRLYRERGQ